jgi:hypothetical protein
MKNISILSINIHGKHDSKNKEWLKKLINLNELTLGWRERFEKILVKLQ